MITLINYRHVPIWGQDFQSTNLYKKSPSQQILNWGVQAFHLVKKKFLKSAYFHRSPPHSCAITPLWLHVVNSKSKTHRNLFFFFQNKHQAKIIKAVGKWAFPMLSKAEKPLTLFYFHRKIRLSNKKLLFSLEHITNVKILFFSEMLPICGIQGRTSAPLY